MLEMRYAPGNCRAQGNAGIAAQIAYVRIAEVTWRYVILVCIMIDPD